MSARVWRMTAATLHRTDLRGVYLPELGRFLGADLLRVLAPDGSLVEDAEGLWAGRLDDQPAYDRQVAGDALYPGTRDGVEALGFLSAVFSILFGDGDPNARLEPLRWRRIAAFLRLHGGVVIAEDLAPLLDLPDCPVHEDPERPITRAGREYVSSRPPEAVRIECTCV